MTCTQKFEAYIKPLLVASGAAYVQFADGDTIDRFNEDTVRADCYPAAFVVAADYKIHNHGDNNIYAAFSPTIYLLKKKIETNNADVFADETTAFNFTEAIGLSFYKKLREQHQIALCLFPKESEFGMERIKEVTIDMALGYELNTKIAIPVSEIFCQ